MEDLTLPVLNSIEKHDDPSEFGSSAEFIVDVFDNYYVKSVILVLDEFHYNFAHINGTIWQLF